MKQILQSLKDGSTKILDIPAPRASRRGVLVATSTSLISAGTERMLVEFGKAGWIEKARQQPDKVRMVLDKVKTDGLAVTIDAVRSKLDQPLPLGYCNVGRVLDVGSGVDCFTTGDRVVSNGKHAEVVLVPRNLCAAIPGNVTDEQASFTVLGAIGLQGIRLLQPTLGEAIVVIGLGLIGLMTVQMLRAHGCRVLGVDFDAARLAMAQSFGAEVFNPASGEDVVSVALRFSRGRGVDGVLITASTASSEPVRQAAHMCRKRGRIVLVGVTGLELARADFYEKELTFQVSCSYGPGRYDSTYEEGGQDYPLAFVRWTEQRNFEAVLDLMSSGTLDVTPLISHRFPFGDAEQAYSLLSSKEPSLGIVLTYPSADVGNADTSALLRRHVTLAPTTTKPGSASVAFLGAGNYAGRILIPAFEAAGATLHTVVSGGGVSAEHYGRKFGFSVASTDSARAFADAAVDTVVVATRHDAHAAQVLAALRANKHVFCEKPLCLTLPELAAIATAARERPRQLLMIGFNRRFAPQVVRMKSLLSAVTEPKSMVMTVNAGAIPADHWTQDRNVGGGRIIGEGCHFIDLLRHLVGHPIVRQHSVLLGKHTASEVSDDKSTITLEFADGSIGTIHYFANGHKVFPKERLEVFCAGRVLQLDNFRKLSGWGWPGFGKMNLWRQDKGQEACARAFVDAIRTGSHSPIPLDEVLEVSRVSIEAASALA